MTPGLKREKRGELQSNSVSWRLCVSGATAGVYMTCVFLPLCVRACVRHEDAWLRGGAGSEELGCLAGEELWDAGGRGERVFAEGARGTTRRIGAFGSGWSCCGGE